VDQCLGGVRQRRGKGQLDLREITESGHVSVARNKTLSISRRRPFLRLQGSRVTFLPCLVRQIETLGKNSRVRLRRNIESWDEDETRREELTAETKLPANLHLSHRRRSLSTSSIFINLNQLHHRAPRPRFDIRHCGSFSFPNCQTGNLATWRLALLHCVHSFSHIRSRRQILCSEIRRE
jgi:hypothetical protein